MQASSNRRNKGEACLPAHYQTKDQQIEQVMSNNKTLPDDSYLPVAWEYQEAIQEEIKKSSKGKIFFFNQNKELDAATGTVVSMEEEKGKGLFVHLDTNAKIRADRIITFFGKIGAAYDEYDAYANACMDCLGGYEKEDL